MHRLSPTLLLISLLALPAWGEDLLILRDGSRRTGQLQACVAEVCRFNGGNLPRTEIAWIRFQGSDSPPQVSEPARDAVFLADGSAHPGHVVGISLGEVAMEEGGFPRPSVAWVWFAGPFPSGGTEAPPPPPPPPPPEGGGEGALWTGTITGRYWGTRDGVFSELNVSVAARLREVRRSDLLLPPARPGDAVKTIGSVITLEPQGTTVTVRFHSSGPYLSCSGTGSTTITASFGEGRFLHPHVIYQKTVDVDATRVLGFDVPLARGALYQLGINTPERFTYTCTSGGHTSQSESGYMIPAQGKTPLLPAGPLVDPEQRFLKDGGTRMEGSYTTTAEGAFEQVEALWNLTRSEDLAVHP